MRKTMVKAHEDLLYIQIGVWLRLAPATAVVLKKFLFAHKFEVQFYNLLIKAVLLSMFFPC